MYLQTLCRVAATVVVICVATPWFLVIVFPLLLIYRHTQNYYIPCSRQLKRIESNAKSPIFSHFAETLDGVSSIRAFGQQRQFIQDCMERVERASRAYYVNVASNRWLAIRTETLGTAIVTASALLAVLGRDWISPGMAGLSLTYSLSVTQALNWVVRMTADRETAIVAVERLSEYIGQTSEAPRWKPQDDPPASWPLEGGIEFDKVQLRYRPGLPLVLDGMCLTVKPHEKVGICGRTGAGKSSILNVLLRIVEIEGGIVKIDGVDIFTIGLHRLRRSITVLPQDPVLFSGTLRFNLDPSGETSDQQDQKIWESLRRAHLLAHAKALAATTAQRDGGAPLVGEPSIAACLDATVAEKGDNFSLGQRQQVCLGRALLRSNKILLLDEATSAVDVETDAMIQQTIKTEFSDHTVLCIAHRISTVMSNDTIVVVGDGAVLEKGPPQELLKKEGSLFKRLAEQDMAR
jgi:ATP-binding cassette subfamily C (CFTR/MRP) protein 1